MTLDANTRRNLELTETIRGGSVHGSLLGVLDQTITPMGRRLIRQWVSKPLLDLDEINHRLDGVEYFITNGVLRAELRAAFKPLSDLERLINRIISGHALPRDLVALRHSLRCLPGLLSLFPETESPLSHILGCLHPCTSELSSGRICNCRGPAGDLAECGGHSPWFFCRIRRRH